MDSKVSLSVGDGSPVFPESSSPIKAIRMDPEDVQEKAALATIPDLAWPSSWHEENEIGKIRSACQERKVTILLNENEKIKGEKDLISKDLETVQDKLGITTTEAKQLRDLNNLLAIRLHKITTENSANQFKQEKLLKDQFEQEVCVLKKEIEVCHENEARILEALESERQRHSQSCKEWELRHNQLEEKIKSMLRDKIGTAPVADVQMKAGGDNNPAVHVMIMTIHQDAGEGNTNENNTTNCSTTHVAEPITHPEEALEVIHESKPLGDKPASLEHEPATPPQTIPRPSSLDINAPEFVRPIPSNVSWADIVEDDSWSSEGSDRDESPPEKSTLSNARETDDSGKGWLSKKNQGEFRSFRAFGHYRTSSFDNSSKRTYKRSPPKHSSYSSQSAGGHVKPTGHDGPRHTRHRSADRLPAFQPADNNGAPWPEWTGTGTDYRNVHKVGSGVLVVDRRTPRTSAPASTGSRRTKSEVPQCKRHIAGYCKFKDQCWFRHD